MPFFSLFLIYIFIYLLEKVFVFFSLLIYIILYSYIFITLVNKKLGLVINHRFIEFLICN